MADTIIITAANASLGIPTVDYLLKHSPKSTLVLTVRNTSDSDANTNALRKVIAKYPNANTSIRQLDLAHLSAVHEFARSIAGEVAAGSLPRLSAIICTAYYWNLVDPLELTDDGFEKTIQVSYLSHTALILRLLGSFRNEGGRIIQFTSDGHEPGKNGLEQIPPKIPTDPSELDQVVKPPADDAATADALGHGFHRYARAKLAVVLWTHALNRRLQRDGQENLHNISAIAMNPGNLADSRALLTNTPTKLHIVSKFILRPFRPLLSMSKYFSMVCR